MRGGIWILNIFAAIWFAVGMAGAGLPWAVLIIPLCISGGLLGWGLRSSGADSPRNPDAGRVVGIWSGIEGVAIFVAVTVCQNIGAHDAIVPVIAIIVGLHFLPLARGIPVPLYYATGSALAVLGLGDLLLPGPDRMGTTGFAAAAIMWVSAAVLIRQARALPAG
jgi:hypothetical protein